MLLLFALFTSFCLASEPYQMDDVGATLYLPKGWDAKDWANWEFKAESKEGMLMYLWLTPYQVDVRTPGTAKSFAEIYAKRVEGLGGGSVETTKAEVTEVAGRPTTIVVQDFKFKGGEGPEGVSYTMAYTSASQVVHIQVLADKRIEKKAESSVMEMMEKLEVKKTPLDTGDKKVETEAGFAASLPAGWREPLPAETELVRAIAAKVGQEKFSPKNCWVAIFPPAKGDPDVLVACKLGEYIGKLDSHSFEDEEAALHEKFFGSAEAKGQKVEPAQMVQIGDRFGMVYKVPVHGFPVRLALAPYDGGLMMIWAIGTNMKEQAMDQVMTDLLPRVTFTGPDGGKPIIGFDKQMVYYLKHRPELLLGACCPLALMIFVVAGGLWWKKREQERLEDIA